MTQSRNENDHFDLDHFDHLFVTFLQNYSRTAMLMLYLCTMVRYSVKCWWCKTCGSVCRCMFFLCDLQC